MADGDGAAVDVYFRRVPSHLTVDADRLRGKRLIDLHEIEILMRPTRLLQAELRCRYGTHTHYFRIHTRGRVRSHRGEGLQPEFLGLASRHHHDRGGAIVDPRRVAR